MRRMCLTSAIGISIVAASAASAQNLVIPNYFDQRLWQQALPWMSVTRAPTPIYDPSVRMNLWMRDFQGWASGYYPRGWPGGYVGSPPWGYYSAPRPRFQQRTEYWWRFSRPPGSSGLSPFWFGTPEDALWRAGMLRSAAPHGR